MYEKGLSIAIVLVAVVFIGTGIMGFYSLEDTDGYCLDNSDCSYSVCCPVASKEYGVCAQEQECGAIYEESKTVYGAPESEELELASQSYIAVALGVVLLLIIGIVSYIEWQEKPAKKKKKRK